MDVQVTGQKCAADPDSFWGWDIWDLDLPQNDQLYLLILSTVIWADLVPQVFPCQADQARQFPLFVEKREFPANMHISLHPAYNLCPSAGKAYGICPQPVPCLLPEENSL